MNSPRFGRALWAALLASSLGGCSIRSYATGALADTFAASGTGYASDDDPELVRDAVPFALKTMEQISAEQPRHVGLFTAMASGFTSYGYAFVQQDADEMDARDVERAGPLQHRARKLFLRARKYALRGLEVNHPGITAAFASEDRAAAARRDALLAKMKPADVPLLYWTAASWALAISDSKQDMRMVGQLPQVEALMARAFALDPDWDQGSIHEFYISYDGDKDGGADRARKHLERALSLAHSEKLGPLVSFAETVDVAGQNRVEFKELLDRVLAYDIDKAPDRRLANVIAQRRAHWLLGRIEELFAQ